MTYLRGPHIQKSPVLVVDSPTGLLVGVGVEAGGHSQSHLYRSPERTRVALASLFEPQRVASFPSNVSRPIARLNATLRLVHEHKPSAAPTFEAVSLPRRAACHSGVPCCSAALIRSRDDEHPVHALEIALHTLPKRGSFGLRARLLLVMQRLFAVLALEIVSPRGSSPRSDALASSSVARKKSNSRAAGWLSTQQ